MSGLVTKLKNWVTGDPYAEDDLFMEDEDYAYQGQVEEQPVLAKKTKGNLRVVQPHQDVAQVVVIEPRAFEEALEIVEHLRMRKAVILNLHMLDTAQSQRVVDFLSGATHAIDGSQQRIGDGVFIFAPNTVAISSEDHKVAEVPEAYWEAMGHHH